VAESDRYLLFRGSDYYPRGGWEDYAGAFPSVEAAVQWAREKPPLPGRERRVVWEGREMVEPSNRVTLTQSPGEGSPTEGDTR
jgi:hypothetical protein